MFHVKHESAPRHGRDPPRGRAGRRFPPWAPRRVQSRRPRRLGTTATAYMGGEQRQGRRGDTVQATRLPHRARTEGGELVLHLARKTRNLPEVEIVRKRQALVAPEGRDVGRLAIEIDRV